MRIAALCLIISASAQSALAGATNHAAGTYANCISAGAADYAQRTGAPEDLAKQIARLCADEVAALSAAYVDDYLKGRTPIEAKDVAKLYVDQIRAANLEIVRLDVTRLRVESENAR